MSLLDRFRDSSLDPVPVHEFAWATRLLLAGHASKGQVMTALGLDATDEPQLDQMIAKHDAEPTAAAKIGFALQVEGIIGLFHEGVLSEAQTKNLLGLL